MALLVVFVLTLMLMVPLIVSSWKPYFILFHLFLPGLVGLYIFTSDRFHTSHAEGGEPEAMRVMWGCLALGISPIFLLIIGPDSGTFVVGSDMWIHTLACVFTALGSLALIRYSPLDSLNMKRDWLVMMVMAAGLYGYGASLTANELFDTSAPRYTTVPITGKYTTTGKGAGSFFKLAAWGDETMERSYRAGLAYDHLQVGNKVCAELHSGAIGMRWYQLREVCPKAQ